MLSEGLSVARMKRAINMRSKQYLKKKKKTFESFNHLFLLKWRATEDQRRPLFAHCCSGRLLPAPGRVPEVRQHDFKPNRVSRQAVQPHMEGSTNDPSTDEAGK